MRYDFTIEVAGRTYNCWREVRGYEVKRQTIYVEGIGEQLDPSLYGAGHYAIEFMATDARQIAIQIVQASTGNPPPPPPESPSISA
jgi:hypothetical protein